MPLQAGIAVTLTSAEEARGSVLYLRPRVCKATSSAAFPSSPPSPWDLNSSSVIFMTFLPSRPLVPPDPPPHCQPREGQVEETRSRDRQGLLPESLPCPSRGKEAPHTPKCHGKHALERASRKTLLLRSVICPFGVSTQDLEHVHHLLPSPHPHGFPKHRDPQLGACARCNVAATHLGHRSTGGQRHPPPGDIPPLCPEQDPSAAGLSHQEPPCLVLLLSSLGTKLQRW